MAACGGDSPTESETVTVEGVNVTAPSLALDLDGTLQLAADVRPPAASQSVTWESEDDVVASVSESGLVTGLAPGEVTIRATSTADASVSGTIDLTVKECPAPRSLSTPYVSEDETWENWISSPICLDYVVSGEATVAGGTLTIEPGTHIGFEADVKMVVAGSGGLVSAGTPEEPILLTGTEEVRGHWHGLIMQSTSNTENRLEHTTISYAGGGGGPYAADLTMETDSRTSLRYVRLIQSAGYGAYIRYRAVVEGGEVVGGSFMNNALGPAYVFSSIVPYLNAADTLPTFTNNDVDALLVEPNQDGITESAVWTDLGVPYRIVQISNQFAFNVASGALTIGPGVHIEFEKDMAMITRGGDLDISGTAERPVVLTGTEPVRGHWRGLQLETSSVSLDHVVIEYGGGPGGPTAADVRVINGGARPTELSMTNTVLRESSGYGLYAEAVDVALGGFGGNVMTRNASGPAYVASNHVGNLGQGDSYIGNDVDRITVAATAVAITEDAVWGDLGAPYYVVGEGTDIMSLGEGTGLVIEPGVEVLFAPGMGFQIFRGALSAVGTEQNRIRFAAESSPWRGLNFFEAQGDFDYVDFVDAGSSGWPFISVAASVSVTSSGELSVAVFGSHVSSSGAENFQAFSYGPTYASPCIPPFYLPAGDSTSDHCN